MKKLILLLISFLTSNVYSIEVKLQCSTNSTYTYSNGTIERGKGNSIILVKDNGDNKSIHITSDIAEVDRNMTISPNQTYGSSNSSYRDISDNNKWEIQNTDYNNNTISDVSIKIDRNTGQFFLTRRFTNPGGNFTLTNASGLCEKIDTSKKKF